MSRYLLALLFLCLSQVSTGQTELLSIDQLAAGWNGIATDGVCSTGTPFQFYARTSAASDNLAIFFNWGGACWFGEACDLNSQPNIHRPFADKDQNNPAFSKGMFDLENADNPFADYNMVFVPYCTGDVHIGGGERVYNYTNADQQEVSVTTYHNGYENSTVVLNWIYANMQSPAKIFVSGSSAGAIGASFYSGLVAEHYPDVPVILLADSGGGYSASGFRVAHEAWNTASALPEWSEYAGETNATISFEDFYIASAKHSSNLTIAQYNAAEDLTQIRFSQLIGDAPGSFSLPQRILNNYLEIESEVNTFYSYTAGGKVHMILHAPIFYSYEVEGVRFRDWIDSLVNGNPVGDISCVNEAGGCTAAPQ